MQPIAAYEEARRVCSPIREFDSYAVLVLLKAHKLVPELDRHALSLRLFNEFSEEGWAADAVDAEARKLFGWHWEAAELALVFGEGGPENSLG